MRLPVAHGLVSVGIVIASVVAIGRSAGEVRVLGEPVASPAIAPPLLSTAGRLAYWRPSPRDELELWVSDLAGSRRFPIATASKDADIALTRWSPDGDAVAWVSGADVHVVRLDRTRTTISFPPDLQDARWRATALEWSPSSKRLAATARAVYGVANEGDVFVAELDRTAATWWRVTRGGDAYAGPWLDDERILVETAAGAIGIVGADGGLMRPLTAMPAVSPRIGPDGRLYFFGGRWGGPALASGPLAAGSVWSMTIDGDDLRRETRAERDQGRLHAFAGDGRFVIGVPGALYVAGDDAVLFPWRAGSVRRAVTSPDGRSAIAFTETRIVRVDLTKVPRSATEGEAPVDASTVLLDGAQAADAWLPRPLVTPIHSVAHAAVGPRERLTFTFGRAIWELRPGGELRPLVSAPDRGWAGGAVPSPKGDLVAATISTPGATDGRYESTTAIIDRSGKWVTAFGSGASNVSWSPDGTELAMWSWSERDGYALQLYDTATWTPGRRFDGARGSWSAAGLVMLGQGRPHPGAAPQQAVSPWARVGQPIDVVTAAGSRRITDADRLAGHPLLRDLPDDASAPPTITQVTPSPDGRHLVVSIGRMGSAGRYVAGMLAIVRTSDGEPIFTLRSDASVGFADFAWSPAGDLLGVTRRKPGPPGQDGATAQAYDLGGRVVLERDGRFAGWSADGERIYVARPEGLFAVRRDGAGETRVSALGVAPVIASRP